MGFILDFPVVTLSVMGFATAIIFSIAAFAVQRRKRFFIASYVLAVLPVPLYYIYGIINPNIRMVELGYYLMYAPIFIAIIFLPVTLTPVIIANIAYAITAIIRKRESKNIGE
ncbi:MAG: hypothetical protein FWC89_08855 [Defluviitaleaceae bacterium]|nr:hypothetical protein [Defluviitaleaceae bacterium]